MKLKGKKNGMQTTENSNVLDFHIPVYTLITGQKFGIFKIIFI